MHYQIWTDGCCRWGKAQARKKELGYGGWAALIVYPDNYEKIISGSVINVYNNHMENLAAIKALHMIPNNSVVSLYSDQINFDTIYRRISLGLSCPNGEYWTPLVEIFKSDLDITLYYLDSKSRDDNHRRVHKIAYKEAGFLMKESLMNKFLGGRVIDNGNKAA